jgi:hypothetical protein
VKVYLAILNNETIFKLKMFWLPFELSFRYTQYGHTLHKQNICNLETFNIILIGFFVLLHSLPTGIYGWIKRLITFNSKLEVIKINHEVEIFFK